MNIVPDFTIGNILVIFVIVMVMIPFEVAYKRYVIDYRQLWRDRYNEKRNEIVTFTERHSGRRGA